VGLVERLENLALPAVNPPSIPSRPLVAVVVAQDILQPRQLLLVVEVVEVVEVAGVVLALPVEAEVLQLMLLAELEVLVAVEQDMLQVVLALMV